MGISSFFNEMINLRPILLRTLIVKVAAKNIFKMKHFSSILSLQRQRVSKGILMQSTLNSGFFYFLLWHQMLKIHVNWRVFMSFCQLKISR